MALPKNTIRMALVLAIVPGLAVGWIYLYSHSHTINADDQSEVINLLKDIKQMDSDWSANVLRSHTDINLNYDALTEPLRPFADATAALAAKVAVLGDAVVDNGVNEIREAIASKTTLIDAFKAQNSLHKNSLRYVPTAHRDIRNHIRSERDASLSSETSARREAMLAFTELAKSVDAARSRESDADAQRRLTQALARMGAKVRPANSTARVSADAMNLEGDIGAVVDGILRYNSVPDRETAVAMRADIDQLRAAVPTYPASVRESINNLLSHLDTLLRLRAKQTDLLHQISQVPVASKVDNVATLLTARFNAELATQFKFQRYLLVYSALALLLIAAGLAFIMYRSATERRRLTMLVDEQTAALKEREVHLIHSQKMSAIGEMVAGVAHEVNTPLAAVKSSLQSAHELIESLADYMTAVGEFLALSVAPKPPDEAGRIRVRSEQTSRFKVVQSLHQEIESFDTLTVMGQLMDDGLHSVEHIYSVVVNMLSFSRLDSTKVISSQIEHGIDSTLIIANHLLRTVKLNKHYGETVPIECDLAQINQVVLNLVKNAVQALPASGGVIDIRTAMLTPKQVQIDVTDNGSGIAAEVLPKIWDPFFTTKEEGVGTGLGLSTCLKIVKSHGGRIDVKSTPGQGTTFSVILPVTPPASLYEQHGQQVGSGMVRA